VSIRAVFIWAAISIPFAIVYSTLVILLATKRYKPMSSFLKKLLERATKTLAQAALALPVVTEIFNQSLDKLGGKVTLVGVAGALSVIMSAITKHFGPDKNDPSAV